MNPYNFLGDDVVPYTYIYFLSRPKGIEANPARDNMLFCAFSLIFNSMETYPGFGMAQTVRPHKRTLPSDVRPVHPHIYSSFSLSSSFWLIGDPLYNECGQVDSIQPRCGAAFEKVGESFKKVQNRMSEVWRVSISLLA